MFCRVAFNLPVDRLFTYSVPAHLERRIAPGMRVVCPFGRRRLVGFVFDIAAASEVEDVKPIEGVLDGAPLISGSMLKLAAEIAHHYIAPLGQVLFAMVPSGVAGGLRGTKYAVLLDGSLASTRKQRAVVDVLSAHSGRLELARLLKEAGVSSGVVGRLRKKGVLRVEEVVEVPRVAPWVEPPVKQLTQEQRNAVDEVVSALGRHEVFLLWGVAGSGKTEVYMRVAEAALERGLKTVVLVPEITLAPQTAGRFVARFGNRVVVLHSRLRRGERAAAWWALRDGSADIVVGPRSAVFAPLAPLGLIVVDEEQEGAYKQQSAPRYHARDVAIMRARLEGAVVLLGSATPDVTTYYAAKNGRYRLLRLKKRVGAVAPPRVEVVDLIKEGLPRSVSLTAPLADALIKTVSSGRQAILFINRRGFAPLAVCENCRFILRCKNCDLPLTYHRRERVMLCHYCGQRETPSRRCPSCWRNAMKLVGAGTERVVSEVAALIGEEPLRLDSDVVTSEERLEEILTAFRQKKASVLVGTQVVAKGLHFPDVDLVGVVYVDGLFNFPDHRAYERGFQLLMQVAGRAGRCVPGRVVLQTVQADKAVLRAALEGDYERFAEQELADRRRFGYPPFRRLIRVVVEALREETARRRAQSIAETVRNILPKDAEILGPAPAPLPRLHRRWRFHILVKLKPDSSENREFLTRAREVLLQHSFVAVDVDPLTLY